MSKDMPIQGGSPQAPKLQKLQKKQDKKFEKASARQLYKNISKGKVENEAIVTKSFGNRTIEVLKGKVGTKITDIETKEEKRSTPRKKVTHAFQRVKNLVLAGKFKNNMQLLQMAQDNLKKGQTPVTPDSVVPAPVVPEEVVHEPVVPAPVVPEEVVPEPTQPVSQAHDPDPVKQEAVKGTKPSVKVKKVVQKKIKVDDFDRLAFSKETVLKDILKDKGTAVLQRTDKKNTYDLCYLNDKNEIVKAELTVISKTQMFLNYNTKKAQSFTSLAGALESFSRSKDARLLVPGGEPA